MDDELDATISMTITSLMNHTESLIDEVQSILHKAKTAENIYLYSFQRVAQEIAIHPVCGIDEIGSKSYQAYADTKNSFVSVLLSLEERLEKISKETDSKADILNNLIDTSIGSVDGADESTRFLHLVKGGGGALTREKIVAAASRKFVCIADESKLVDILGSFPLPIEVVPMARSYVARELVKLGGEPVLREGFTTDNGNIILDIHGLQIMEPAKFEAQLNNIAGVVTNGLFAIRPADVLLLGTSDGVKTLT